MSSRAWRPRRKTWRIQPVRPDREEFARRAQVTPLVAQLLLNRGLDTREKVRAFFDPKLTDLHDPTLLDGIEPAARRIARALADAEHIVIYGDYDVDGMTAVAILEACFRLTGGRAEHYIPHRLEEGYGVNAEAVRGIAASGADLLITVDCGISAAEALSETGRAGMDVIVTDHHSPPASLPDVAAVVHPGLAGGRYPNRALCGAGVALKLAWQVAREVCGANRVDEEMRTFLLDATTLAALGTIADVVPLVGENRSLATFGLRGLAATKHRGLRALLDSASLKGGKLDAYDVGFKLAPRLNACGRMGHARLAVELLTNPQAGRAAEIARYLTQQNAERQKVEREITAEAVELARAKGMDTPDHAAIVLAGDHWHGGVIGIVAARLVDRFSKPAFVLTRNGDEIVRGSGRSVPGFHMREALAACSEHLLGFGGHAMAGGVTLAADRIEAFAETLGAYARLHVPREELDGGLEIDAACSLNDLSYATFERIARMAPFGEGNRPPVLAIEGCGVLNPPKRMGRTGQTIGMVLGQNGQKVRAVGFRMGDLADAMVGVNEVSVAAEPMLNHYNGRTSPQLRLIDVRW